MSLLYHSSPILLSTHQLLAHFIKWISAFKYIYIESGRSFLLFRYNLAAPCHHSPHCVCVCKLQCHISFNYKYIFYLYNDDNSKSHLSSIWWSYRWIAACRTPSLQTKHTRDRVEIFPKDHNFHILAILHFLLIHSRCLSGGVNYNNLGMLLIPVCVFSHTNLVSLSVSYYRWLAYAICRIRILSLNCCNTTRHAWLCAMDQNVSSPHLFASHDSFNSPTAPAIL